MHISRGARLGLAAVAALTLALTGCSSQSGSPTSAGAPTSAAPKLLEPKAALAASVKDLAAGNFGFGWTAHEEKASGAVHVPSRTAKVDIEATGKEVGGTINVRMIDSAYFMKMKLDLKGAGVDLDELADNPATKEMAKKLKEAFSGEKWNKLDIKKLKDAKEYEFDLAKPDITGASALLTNVVTAERKADGTITGTADATKADVDALPWSADEVKSNADKLKALPFEATLDAQGRISKLTLSVPAIGDKPEHKRVIEISGYGTMSPQEKPPANETVEAADSTYELLNG